MRGGRGLDTGGGKRVAVSLSEEAQSVMRDEEKVKARVCDLTTEY